MSGSCAPTTMSTLKVTSQPLLSRLPASPTPFSAASPNPCPAPIPGQPLSAFLPARAPGSCSPQPVAPPTPARLRPPFLVRSSSSPAVWTLLTPAQLFSPSSLLLLWFPPTSCYYSLSRRKARKGTSGLSLRLFPLYTALKAPGGGSFPNRSRGACPRWRKGGWRMQARASLEIGDLDYPSILLFLLDQA